MRESTIPFVVHSGTVQIKAVGTKFNVHAYSSDKIVETTLVSGKIVVTGTGHRKTTEKEMTLLPNQKLIISNAPEVTVQTKIDSDETVSTPHENVVLKEKIDPAPEIS